MFSIRYLPIISETQSKIEMEKIGVDPVGVSLMLNKLLHLNLKVEGLTPPQANILKQEFLSVGGEAAVPRGVITCDIDTADAILSGTEKQFVHVIEKLKLQPFGLEDIGNRIKDVIDNIHKKEFVIKCKNKDIVFGRKTLVMGVLNITSDSFSDGGLYIKKEDAVKRVMEMTDDGADIIDIGGESSRPGSLPVSLNDELDRVLPVIKEVAKNVNVPISIDTTKAEVARQAIENGADIVNDISALRFDKDMADVCARNNVPVILMHMRGTPQTMQTNLKYDNLMSEIFCYLSERIAFAKDAGIKPEKIMIDPGICFGKSAEDNLKIISRLEEFKGFGMPIVIGTSKKSFIGKTLNLDIDDRLEGTAATVAASILKGANIVRVHDVKEMRRVADMVDAIKNQM
ncbi:MAG: dihydropteroate synthase [Deltaproteobacteria bacterium]|nr:dihydropteroate synthase [Deltaproteobacteria bacterium]